MPRIQFSDVTPPSGGGGRRSIRDVPIPNGGKRKVPINIKPEIAPTKVAIEEKEKGAYEYYYPKNQKEPMQNGRSLVGPKRKKLIFGGIAVVAVLVFIFSMMTVFSSATILITPKSQEVEISTDIIGTIEAGKDSIRYEVVKLSRSQIISIPATGEEMVELKAHGKIIVYNNFSSEPQRLIVRTRFESPEGLIYRIPESIVIPGKTASGPGSIEVEVFADEAGEKYNTKKTDFTVPGFKNDAARYKDFYARSATEMAGGFVGKMKTVPESEKLTALQNIDSEIQSLLEKDFQSKISEELVLLSGATIYESHELPQKEESSSVLVGKEGTSYAVMLNKKDLSDKLVQEYISGYPDWDGISAVIKDFSSLVVSNELDKTNIGEEMDLNINGMVQILADIDPNLLSQKLVGIPRKDATMLMDEFAGISGITATIRPIWKQSFPDNPLKINVQVAAIK